MFILHSNIDNFYANAECLTSPELRRKPLAVVGDATRRHGIVLAVNEAAKRMGVKTGESVWCAEIKCPELVSVPARFDTYMRYAAAVRRIYMEYSDRVEPFGLDGAWIDITKLSTTMGEASHIADEIRERVKNEIGLTVFIGVSFNKSFAKLGSDMKKPDGTAAISKENFKEMIWSFPVRDLLYVGKKTESKMKLRGLNTIGDVAKCSEKRLCSVLGKWGSLLYAYANGWDITPVRHIMDASAVKSISNSTTAAQDMYTYEAVKHTIVMLTDSIAQRMKAKNVRAKTVSIYVKDKNFNRFTRKMTLKDGTDEAELISNVAMELFRNEYCWKNGIRSIGLSVSGLKDRSMGRIVPFEDRKKKEMERVLGNMRLKPGQTKAMRGVVLEDDSVADLNSGVRH